MLKENKIVSALKYGAGEIILVVIGILIAFQIDGWSAQQSANELEYEILQNLHRDLLLTKIELENDITFNQMSKLKLETSLKNIDNNVPYSASMDTLFTAIANWESPLPTLAAYEVFKSQGVDVISNSKVTEGVITFYESSLGFLINDYDKSEWAFFQNVSLPFISKHLFYNDIDETTVLTPNNYDVLAGSDEFRNILAFTIAMREKGLNHYNTSLAYLNSLIKLVDKEIKVKK